LAYTAVLCTAAINKKIQNIELDPRDKAKAKCQAGVLKLHFEMLYNLICKRGQRAVFVAN